MECVGVGQDYFLGVVDSDPHNDYGIKAGEPFKFRAYEKDGDITLYAEVKG